jgi:hypothetical protein
MTKKEACEQWVNGFNAIPHVLIKRAYIKNIDDITEITPSSVGNYIYSFNHSEYGEIIEKLSNGNIKAEINDEVVEIEEEDFEVQRDDFLPMWGTMWQFGDSCDKWWLEENGGLQIMANCGFRIYKTDDIGYIFGIDGAGYDFYEEHWIPLYEARGLLWHDKVG